MTIGNFSPILGSTGNDFLSSSFFAEDNNNNLGSTVIPVVDTTDSVIVKSLTILG